MGEQQAFCGDLVGSEPDTMDVLWVKMLTLREFLQ